MRIAIQGTSGAFHEFAARKWRKGESVTLIYCQTFRDVFESLATGRADQAVVAAHNSAYGDIKPVQELLPDYPFFVVAKITLHIHLQLIGLPGHQRNTITQVYSQDVALAQCKDFLAHEMPQATPMEYFDTAASVAFVKEQNNLHFAAIASRSSAEYFGLAVLAENIEDSPQNFTQFIVLQKQKPTSEIVTVQYET